MQTSEPLFAMDGPSGGRRGLRRMEARCTAATGNSIGHTYRPHIQLHRPDEYAESRLGNGAGHYRQPAPPASGRSCALRFRALPPWNRRRLSKKTQFAEVCQVSDCGDLPVVRISPAQCEDLLGDAQSNSATEFLSKPIPSISISTTSPGFMKT